MLTKSFVVAATVIACWLFTPNPSEAQTSISVQYMQFTNGEEVTALYYNEDDELLWVEHLGNVKERIIVPTFPVPSILFGRDGEEDHTVQPKNHAANKKVDLIDSSAVKAVYCGGTWDALGENGRAVPLFAEDLTKRLDKRRVIDLAAGDNVAPCSRPKKCHCIGGDCCCR